MEDKELQELFAAKQTVEANRRRQERLSAAIAGQSKVKSRRPWPLWITSAAASIAVLLMTTPQLFRSDTTEPPLVAQTPEITATEDPESIQQDIPSTTGLTSKTSSSSTSTTSITCKPEDVEALPAVEETPAPEASATEPAAEQQPEPQKPQRRVHRRTSTRIVTTGNAANTVKHNYRKAVADVICQEESNTIILHTIELS